MIADTPQARIEAAQRIDSFLKDEAVGGALTRMERMYYEEFLAADSSELRVRAWAKAKALRDFEAQLRVVVGAGEDEVELAARKAAKDAQKPSLL